ncbi:MAG: hypothetical protein K9N55_06025 [Phycisphaerae bacterium]|nr:hypothetical protein [Phycisphaerae bacterium]
MNIIYCPPQDIDPSGMWNGAQGNLPRIAGLVTVLYTYTCIKQWTREINAKKG